MKQADAWCFRFLGNDIYGYIFYLKVVVNQLEMILDQEGLQLQLMTPWFNKLCDLVKKRIVCTSKAFHNGYVQKYAKKWPELWFLHYDNAPGNSICQIVPFCAKKKKSRCLYSLSLLTRRTWLHVIISYFSN